jgi:signal transduction histidine kinase
VGQNLSALNLNLSLLNGYLPNSIAKKTKKIMDDSMNLLEETTEQIRDVMARLRPVGLEEYGLAAAIHWYARRFSDRTGVKVETDLGDYIKRLPLPWETELFRIAQEALTNILKHARAQKVTVSLRPVGDRLRLVISDDGKGFEVRNFQVSTEQSGWGLVSMKERVYGLNGKFRVVSEPGKGTIVVVEVDRRESA